MIRGEITDFESRLSGGYALPSTSSLEDREDRPFAARPLLASERQFEQQQSALADHVEPEVADDLDSTFTEQPQIVETDE